MFLEHPTLIICQKTIGGISTPVPSFTATGHPFQPLEWMACCEYIAPGCTTFYVPSNPVAASGYHLL